MLNVPFVDLNRQYDSIKKEVDSKISAVLESGHFILGKDVENFEGNFASFIGVKNCVGLDNGTSALELSLRALGIGEGDEVITVANTFIATASSIAFTGARPVLVDIDKEIYNIDVTKIEEAITPKTKAIMPVHLYGQPADMDEITKIAKKHDLFVIEDACQSHGAEYRGRKTGSLGNVAAFSFYPAKNLGCFGDGGAIVTDDDRIAEKIRMLRDYGQKEKYQHMFIAYNRRLDTIQAAVLGVKLKYLEKWNQRRREVARLYNEGLKNIDVVTPVERDYNKHVYHLYVIRTKERDRLKEFLQAKGISTGIHYLIPIHLQPAFKHLGYEKGDFPVTEGYSKEILSLPIFPELKKEEVEYISDCIAEFYEHGM